MTLEALSTPKNLLLILSGLSKTLLVDWGTVGKVVPVSKRSASLICSPSLLGRVQCGSYPEENPPVVMLQERSHVRALDRKDSSALL